MSIHLEIKKSPETELKRKIRRCRIARDNHFFELQKNQGNPEKKLKLWGTTSSKLIEKINTLDDILKYYTLLIGDNKIRAKLYRKWDKLSLVIAQQSETKKDLENIFSKSRLSSKAYKLVTNKLENLKKNKK